MAARSCPTCGLYNPEGALRCDCGYDFRTGTMKRSYVDGVQRPERSFSVYVLNKSLDHSERISRTLSPEVAHTLLRPATLAMWSERLELAVTDIAGTTQVTASIPVSSIERVEVLRDALSLGATLVKPAVHGVGVGTVLAMLALLRISTNAQPIAVGRIQLTMMLIGLVIAVAFLFVVVAFFQQPWSTLTVIVMHRRDASLVEFAAHGAQLEGLLTEGEHAGWISPQSAATT